MPGRLRQSAVGMRAAPLIVGLVLVSMGPLVLLTWLSVSLSTTAVQRQAEARVQNTATSGALYLDQQLDSLAELVGSFAGRPTVVAAMQQPPGRRDPETLAAHLRQLRQARPGIAVAFVTDPAGRLLAIVPATPSIVGEDFSFRDWYRGVTTTGRPYVSEVYQTAAAGHALVVAAAVQIRAPDGHGKPGRVLGVLVAAYGLDTMQRFVDEFASAQGVRLTVTDQRGVQVAAPGAPPGGLTSRRHDPLVAAALAGRAGVSQRTTATGPVVSAYGPVGRIGWTITADVDADLALAPVRELRRTVLAIAATLGLILLAGLVLLARSLRQRARAERRLAASEEHTRAILEAADEAFISMDTQGLVTGWNTQAAETFGWSHDEALGREVAELIIPPPFREAHQRGLQHYLATGEGPVLNRRLELAALHRDSHQFPIELAIWPVGSGEQVSFNAFAHDISQRRQAAEALEQAKLEAEQANQAKSGFLSRMSHELRTPLNAILGFAQLLRLDDLPHQQRENVDQILRGGRHLLGLINEVLDISRIETGTLGLSLEPVAVLEVLNETIDLIRPLAAERDIRIQAPARHGGPWTVRADRQRLKQVLLNLAGNAVKYNQHGGGIHLSCHTADGRVSIVVADTGPGIPADKLQRLFTPFDRLGAEQTDIQGSGMGLALSKALTEAMGGTLTAHSVEGQGSTFTVELAADELPLHHQTWSQAPTPPRQIGAHPDRTVLYVEDNPANLQLVEHILQQRGGVRLLTTHRGDLVHDLVRQHHPDLVLLDLHLPDMDGEEVLHNLHADPATAALPVVVISADALPSQVQRLLAAGATRFLTKPLDVPGFLAVIDELLAAVHR